MGEAARQTTNKDSFKEVINSPASLSAFVSRVTTAFREHKYLVGSIRPGQDRSEQQNRLWRRMYIRIAETTGQGTDDEVWAYCKLMIGVPILSKDCARFAAGFDRYFGDKSFEEQLFLMGKNPLFGPNGFPVTSLFGTKQGCQYTDGICDHYAPQGVFFDDILEAAK